jgi:hypothetical protein
MPDGINIEIRDTAVTEALERLRGRLADLSPALEEVGAVFEQRVQLRFESKRDPLGCPWDAPPEFGGRGLKWNRHGRIHQLTRI